MNENKFMEGLEEKLATFESAKDKLVLQLLSSRKKEKMLQRNLFFTEYLDLLIRVSYSMDDPEGVNCSIPIDRDWIAKWGITPQELCAEAMMNTIRREAPVMQDLRELRGIEDDDVAPVYVLTNQSGCYGASVILYPQLLERIADIFEEDLLLVPSSIHEVLVLPGWKEDPAHLKEMVLEVNTKLLLADAFLSNSIYRFSREEKKLTILELEDVRDPMQEIREMERKWREQDRRILF